MAKVGKNIIITGLSGSLGDQLVIKMGKGGQTVISTSPKFPEGREFTAAQTAQQQRFSEAAAYAKDAAKQEPLYAEKAAGTAHSAYNVALADFLHAPEILEVDVSGYTGQVGQTIRARAGRREGERGQGGDCDRPRPIDRAGCGDARRRSVVELHHNGRGDEWQCEGDCPRMGLAGA
jgi:hypothetical protein